MGLCVSIACATCRNEAEVVEECKPELASGRFDSFSKSMSRSFSFMRDAPRFSNAIDNGDYSILAKSQTTGTTTIQDLRIALEKLSANHAMKGQAKTNEVNSPNSKPLFPPLILHISNVLAARKIAALESGKGDAELGIPPKAFRSRSLHDQSLGSSFRSMSFNVVNRRHTKIPSHESWEAMSTKIPTHESWEPASAKIPTHESWEAMSSDLFKSFEKSIEK